MLCFSRILATLALLVCLCPTALGKTTDASVVLKTADCIVLRAPYDEYDMRGTFTVTDHDGHELASFSGSATASVKDVHRDEDGLLVLLARQPNGHKLCEVQRYDRKGRWTWIASVSVIGDCDRLYPDGAGGAWIAYPIDERRQALHHIGDGGKYLSEYVLSAENLLVNLYTSASRTDGATTLYGTAVSHSSGVYDVFALTLGQDGSMLNLDVREFNVSLDYAIHLRRGEDGIVYACSDVAVEHEPVYTPFDSLPRKQDDAQLFHLDTLE